jgi:hypothetical protein
MKPIKFAFLLLLLTPSLSKAQYTGGNGRGDISAEHFGSALSINDIIKAQPFTIYASGNSVYINLKPGSMVTGEVILLNSIGQQLKRSLLNDNQLTMISLDQGTGCFFVKVNTSNKSYLQKVFLQQE